MDSSLHLDKKPSWIKVRLPNNPEFWSTKSLITDLKLLTVCEEAQSPNRWECWGQGTATFMIAGDKCTRACGFCAVKTAKPDALESDEPARIAEATPRMNLKHIVITAVARDDLKDGGAEHFRETIRAVRQVNPGIIIEVLVPDFNDRDWALQLVMDARPHIFNHNLETVERLTPLVRSRAKYQRSLTVLKKAKQPLIIIGESSVSRGDGAEVLSLASQLAMDCGAVTADWNGFSVLHHAASRVGGLDIGFVPGRGGKDTAAMLAGLDVLFLLGADELDLAQSKVKFTVYIGTHGDVGAHHADVILPASAYTEKSGTYVNTEGRVQRGNRAAFAPGMAKEDWAIIRALSDELGARLPWDSLAGLRLQMMSQHPHLGELDMVAESNALAEIKALAKKSGKVLKSPFQCAVSDFYLTNPIARASAVMAECSALARGDIKQAAE